MMPKMNAEHGASHISRPAHSSILTQEDQTSISHFWRKISKGSRRCSSLEPIHVLTRMDPEEHDVVGRIFNMASGINIYTGLLVSGLIGYVLTPDTAFDEDVVNALTGLRVQSLVELQMLLSQMNLLMSMVIFAFSFYVMFFVMCETPRTVVRVAARMHAMWHWAFISFVQIFLILAQSLIAAVTYMSPSGAKTSVAVMSITTLVIVCWCLDLLFDMFPVTLDGWFWVNPPVMLRQLICGRGYIRRLGQFMAEEAAEASELEYQSDASGGVNIPDAYDAGASDPCASSSQMQQLRIFLQAVFPSYSTGRTEALVSTLLGHDLGAEVLQEMVMLDPALLVHMPIETTSVGERVLIARAAKEQASANR